ncbi:MAG TPA: hypothetical protein VG496_14195, partial [Myxococcales bacterium]|nr:hypothetical protein [Myxococcales bacterium]
VAFAVGLLAAVGLAREAWFHFVSEPIWNLPATIREARGEERYRAVRAALPRDGRVGYVSDEPVNTTPGVLAPDRWGTWLYQEAQYALAPVVLVVGDTGTKVVLANLKDAARLEEVAQAHRLRVAQRFEGGSVALLRR